MVMATILVIGSYILFIPVIYVIVGAITDRPIPGLKNMTENKFLLYTVGGILLAFLPLLLTHKVTIFHSLLILVLIALMGFHVFTHYKRYKKTTTNSYTPNREEINIFDTGDDTSE
jgi:Ca2+/Na+ antiporter